jgi:hypothetical protein
MDKTNIKIAQHPRLKGKEKKKEKKSKCAGSLQTVSLDE